MPLNIAGDTLAVGNRVQSMAPAEGEALSQQMKPLSTKTYPGEVQELILGGDGDPAYVRIK